jgi:hypothetical protein
LQPINLYNHEGHELQNDLDANPANPRAESVVQDSNFDYEDSSHFGVFSSPGTPLEEDFASGSVLRQTVGSGRLPPGSVPRSGEETPAQSTSDDDVLGLPSSPHMADSDSPARTACAPSAGPVLLLRHPLRLRPSTHGRPHDLLWPPNLLAPDLLQHLSRLPLLRHLRNGLVHALKMVLLNLRKLLMVAFGMIEYVLLTTVLLVNPLLSLKLCLILSGS